ncbi:MULTISPECIES: ArsR/SmtB family transcription factor [Paenibacillus]|uniref:ArsR/SmtB family transcription factor n=1 Tax=Paenibacillus TaxID=44249 RepID=UPI0038739804
MKALSNETRLQIMEWLREPDQNFGPQLTLPPDSDFTRAVCVGSIQEKAGLSQSVISGYLTALHKAGLLESRRFGQWTYYRRNENTIRRFAEFIGKDM